MYVICVCVCECFDGSTNGHEIFYCFETVCEPTIYVLQGSVWEREREGGREKVARHIHINVAIYGITNMRVEQSKNVRANRIKIHRKILLLNYFFLAQSAAATDVVVLSAVINACSDQIRFSSTLLYIDAGMGVRSSAELIWHNVKSSIFSLKVPFALALTLTLTQWTVRSLGTT